MPLPAGGLAPGACVNVEFQFSVTQGGSFAFGYNAEATFAVLGCVVSAELRPASGQFIPQMLALSATTSTDSCGRPLRYFWVCDSDTTPECADFDVAANADGNTNARPAVQINTFDEIAISLTVCAVDPASSDPRVTAPR